MDFFSKIFKHKKILFFVCLFLFVFTFSLTANIKIAHADCLSDQVTCMSACPPSNNTTCENACITAYNACGAPIRAANSGSNGLIAPSTDCKDDWGWSIASGVVAGIVDIIEWIPKEISWIVAKVTGWVMDTVLNWPTTNPGSSTDSAGKGGALAFMTGWASNRDLANMLIVLGFIVVAISFALRLGEYGSKKVLVNLIMVALLVNFSGLFCGLIIDASNLTMRGLIQGTNSSGPTTSSNMSTIFFGRINSAEEHVSCPLITNKDLTGYIASDIMFGYLYLMLVSCFIFLSFMIVVRYAALGILFMMAPLAFFCWVFPATKGMWNKWITAFLKWAFIGVYMCFFLNIVGNMVDGMKVLTSTNSNPDLLSLIAYFLICILTLFVGYYVSLKAAAATAPAVVGAVKTAVGFATGAVVGFAAGGLAGATKGAMSGAKKGGMGGGAMGGAMAGGAAGAAGGTGLAGGRIAGGLAGARDAITGGLEYMGVIKSGRANLNRQSRLSNKLNEKDRTERMNAMTAEQRVDLINNPRRGNSARLDRAFAMKDLAKNDQLNMIANDAVRTASINEALNSGVRQEDLVDGMSDRDIANRINAGQLNAVASTKGAKRLIAKGSLHMVDVAHREELVNAAATQGMGVGEFAKADYRYRDYDTGANGRVTVLGAGAPAGSTAAQRLDYGRRAARAEQIEASIGSMAPVQRRNIDTADITPELLTAQSINAGIIRDFRTSDAAHVAHFGTPGSIAAGTTGVINPAIDGALARAETAAAGNTNEINRIRGIRAEIYEGLATTIII